MTTGNAYNNLPPRHDRRPRTTNDDHHRRGAAAEAEPAAATGSLVGLFAPPPPPQVGAVLPQPNETTALLPQRPPQEEEDHNEEEDDDDAPSFSAHHPGDDVDDDDDVSASSSPAAHQRRASRSSSSSPLVAAAAAAAKGDACNSTTPDGGAPGERTSGLLAHDFFEEFKAIRQPKVQFVHNDDTTNAINTTPIYIPCWHHRVRNNAMVQSLLVEPTTIAGSLMFLLYHVVFVLAFGSALMVRPHADDSNNSNNNSILGVMAKLSAVGIFAAGPLYIYRLNHDIPAVYPSVDLFLAPFLAQAVVVVDESLWEQHQQQHTTSSSSSSQQPDGGGDGGSYPDELFFGSFAVLASLGMTLAGLFLYLGSTFKLANLGTYLPYSVLSGFFSAVGVLLWCLAFSVDTSGKSWKTVFFSKDAALIGDSCLHHAPSLVIGILMNKLGPKNPFYVILLLVATQIIFYTIMVATGTTLEDAQRLQWFWSKDELVYRPRDSSEDGAFAIEESTASSFGWSVPSWALPPSPFGSFGAILAGHVNWTAVVAGMPNMAALAFLYLLRSSIHASAMKKNVSNLVRRIPIKTTTSPNNNNTSVDDYLDISQTTVTGNKNVSKKSDHGDVPSLSQQKRQPTSPSPTSIIESVRNSVSIVQLSMQDRKPLIAGRQDGIDHHSTLATTTSLVDASATSSHPQYTEIRAKAPRRSLESIFSEYSYALFMVAVVGGFGVCPTVATSNTVRCATKTCCVCAPTPEKDSHKHTDTTLSIDVH